MNHPWQYDETVQAGTDYGDEKEIAAYDEGMLKLRDVEAEAKEIQKALSLSAKSVVWEIGTGTGECALALAANVKHVYACDVSTAMLAFAHDKAERRGVKNVTFETGGFLSEFRPTHPIDGIVSQLALHHLPDFWKSRALVAIVNALRPNGRLYLRDVVFPSKTNDYDAFFKKAISELRAHAGDEMAEQTVQHIKTEFSTLDWILEEMIARSGLKIVQKECSGFIVVYVCEKIMVKEKER